MTETTTRSHPCPVPGCHGTVRHRHWAVCGRHWQLVPPGNKTALRQATREKVQGGHVSDMRFNVLRRAAAFAARLAEMERERTREAVAA